MSVRTRIAPSPTGFFHVGNLRTALFDYALAKKHGGQFVLRIEDTDRTRYIPEAVDFIVRMFKEFGLQPDEGVGVGGPYAPYSQSERLEVYMEYAEKLVDQGKAYYCFLDNDAAEELRAQGPLRSPYRDMDLEDLKKRADAGEKYVIRYKMPKDLDIDTDDPVQGKITINSNEIEDWVMIKSDGFPVYNFAVVIDDALMKITHVFRGIEFISSVPKNILLYRDFGWEPPVIVHLPVLLDPDGGKMSKRKGAVSVEEFLNQGYLPEAILNFLMLLGWSSPEKREFGESEREIYSVSEFTELFDIKDLNKSNAVFNRDKLLWFNQQYIIKMDSSDLAEVFVNWVTANVDDSDLAGKIIEDSNLVAKLELVKQRAKTLLDIVEGLKFFYESPQDIDWSIKQLNRINEAGVLDQVLAELIGVIEGLGTNSSNWEHEAWEQAMRELADKHELKHGDVFMALRIAVVGSPFSPPLFEAMQIIGGEGVIERLQKG